MPKYFPFKIAGYYLYFTMACIVECIHTHASDSKLTEAGSPQNCSSSQTEIPLFRNAALFPIRSF
jgi:hypothetical protein